MGFVVKVVLGFEYTMFAGDSMHNVTSPSWGFYTEGVDMDNRF
jgi:hypothetical protein